MSSRATQLSILSLTLGLALAGCSSSSTPSTSAAAVTTTPAASSAPDTSATSAPDTTAPDTTAPDTTAPDTTAPDTTTSVQGASGDCKKATDAVEAMASVISQTGSVTKVEMLNGCDTLKVSTKLTASDAAVALAICSQLDSPAYAGGAKSVQIATADGSVVLAKGSKGAACTAGA